MARRKKLTLENLAALGPETLAGLLLDEAARNKLLKRELTLLLTAQEGPEAAAREVRKRLNALARSRSFVDWQRIRELERDLDQQYRIITERIAPADSGLALDLLWRFLELAGPTLERCDDSNGVIGGVFRRAAKEAGPIAESASVGARSLADEIMARLRSDRYGICDNLVASMFPALGQVGVARLKERLKKWRKEVEAGPRPAKGDWQSRSRHDHARHVIEHCLQELADAEGDVDAFIATHDEEALENPVVASEIATRLVAAGRAEEALACLDRARPEGDFGLLEWHDAQIAALVAVGDAVQAQALRRQIFERTLLDRYLRDYLAALPDFDDIEAEDAALTRVEAFGDVHRALAFLVDWPALERASRVAIARCAELDGNRYYVLAPAAEALEGKYPLASVLLRRGLIEDTLNGAKSRRYKHAARHILEIESLDDQIDDYAPHEDHAAFMARLREKHGRKGGFWSLLG